MDTMDTMDPMAVTQTFPGVVTTLASAPEAVDWLRCLRDWCRTGDETCLAQVIEQHAPLVRSACRRVLGSGADCDDAVQETFIRLARDAGAIHSNLSGWLYTTARSIAINMLTARQARHRREAAAGGDVHGTCGRDQGGGDEELLERHLAALSEADRTLLVEYYWLGESQDLIGRRLGISQVAASKRIDAAVNRLRRRIGSTVPLLALMGAMAAPAGLDGGEEPLIAVLKARGLPSATPAALSTASVLLVLAGIGALALGAVMLVARDHSRPAATGPAAARPTTLVAAPAIAMTGDKPALPLASPPPDQAMAATPAQLQTRAPTASGASGPAAPLLAGSDGAGWQLHNLRAADGPEAGQRFTAPQFQIGFAVRDLPPLRPEAAYAISASVHGEEAFCPFFGCALLLVDRKGRTCGVRKGRTCGVPSTTPTVPIFQDRRFVKKLGPHALEVRLTPVADGRRKLTWHVDGALVHSDEEVSDQIVSILLLVSSGRVRLAQHTVAVIPPSNAEFGLKPSVARPGAP